ncbi:MAG: DUF192 domain-containing protein [Planctomycetota bacterium]
MIHQLIREDGGVLLARLQLANTFWSRFLGLQFRKTLDPDQGLMLSPCSSLHTCFMRFPIDVVMLDRDHVVVGARRGVRPWRAVICDRRTHAIIETAEGSLDCRIGDRLRIDRSSGAARVA